LAGYGRVRDLDQRHERRRGTSVTWRPGQLGRSALVEQEIADELGRSKSDIARVCHTLGCATGAQAQCMIL